MTDDLPNPALLPAGLTDLLPPDAEREALLVEVLAETFARHGYDRVKPPLLEFEDSLFAGSGAAVADQTFRLMDPVSQRMMGLRADITPQVARIAATRLGSVPRPLRLSYAGQVLRVRGSELAPSRQLPQAGIELIGVDTPAADAEVAAVTAEALRAVGITGASLDITLPRLAPTLLDAAGVRGEARQRLARALDRKDAAAVAELGDACGMSPGLLSMLLAAAGPVDGALAALEAAQLPPAARAMADNAAAVVAVLRGLVPALRITLDPVEFRGFRYHTGVAFTVFGEGMIGELARGGRYISGEEPATGMTLYPDALLRAVAPATLRRRVFVGAGADPAAVAALRAQGCATLMALSPTDTPRSLRCTHILRTPNGVTPLED